LNAFKNYIKLASKTINEKKQILQSLQSLIEDELNLVLEVELASEIKYKCVDCGTNFAHRQGLHRHNKFNRCKAKKEKPKGKTKDQSPE